MTPVQRFFATFNIPAAPDPTVMPVTQPGEFTECGGGNFRLTVHDAANAGPGRFGFPRYINASRMTLQPAAAARNGVVYLAWSNSISLIFGDPNGNSNVLFMRSDDGGQTDQPARSHLRANSSRRGCVLPVGEGAVSS
ncbi:MAG TPA: hypothetical protein VK466_07245 [Terriglobales bacterium]|nr:hypothetical protein [Terriglobales bacterium]